MRMILGLDAPDAGHARIGGQAYRQFRWPLREAGGLLESRAFHPGRSARAHLAALAASNSISQSRVAEVLEIVGLGSVARKRAGKFSLGMAQRLGIAAALLGDPAVLLLDEPVNGLDPEGIRWIRGLLRSLAAEGRAVLVSSHLISEMALMADRLVVGSARDGSWPTPRRLSCPAGPPQASKRLSCNSPAIVPSTRQGTCHDRPHQPPATRQIPIPAAGPDGMDQAAQPALHLAHPGHCPSPRQRASPSQQAAARQAAACSSATR